MQDGKIIANIAKFTALFHSYLKSVSLVEIDGPDAKRYNKILCFSLLEALAKARYPKRGASCAFGSFVVRYAGWAEGDKVSLPHLVAALERAAEPAFDSLRQFAYARLKEWGTAGPLCIDRDLDKSELQTRWPKAQDGNDLLISALKLDWTHLQHRKLLYSYRSKLSHESREATFSFEDSTEPRPFYEHVGNDWNLVYPFGFLAATCHAGIEALRVWLITECKDPYEQFKFGHFLVKQLNDPKYTVINPFNDH
jgi:hypothetical protein